ncbi:D-alanyl-D-alanine carboxypeptidase/D-alanyl-D-alanine-endopeptidase [Bordetella genomosp. 9]|uniref:D-alanyl-D-alanine carboxypeptidase/D-alanyl-D-alanine-endopeptidase n=1 Tax=Bordetella genomosp. 9 TaxID=1416803 RepID=A0A261RNN2_9BORD|nr:D-alanyl-D-alanine carboxypeptidase/D-alanyl-D-alanine-endopeptidase [Bordetella genomosp. 9]OZI26511.1 D-alanyl-D-alanine carboxypeptidase/D-alanyl-D-alanine-endopeptidase [Bordetella genomosp. 9]
MTERAGKRTTGWWAAAGSGLRQSVSAGLTVLRAATVAALTVGVAGVANAQGLAPASANVLPHDLAATWRASKLPSGSLSLVVQELGGQRLLSINAKEPRNPASVMKLVTTWSALSSLGANYTWRTELLAQPGARPNASGVLPGPLYLRAGGDPLFMLQDLWTLLRDLRLHGVRQINDLVIDRTIFGPVATDPGAFDGAPDRPYNASPDALMVGFGALRLLFIPDPAARRWRPVIDPPLPGVSLSGQVEWSDATCPGSPDVSTEPLITQQGITLRVTGTVAGSCGEFSLYRLALSQADFATDVIRQLWREMGGTFTGQVRAGMVPPDAVPLASHESPPLGDIIRTINKRSNNVMARLLLLTLGAEGGRRPATPDTGAAVVRRVLGSQGLSMPELVIDNGSGLSRTGRVSADSLASMLTVAWNSPYMPEFMSSLAIAGVDGTVRRRLRDKDTRGMAHLKTGSLANVRAMAGYVLGASGKRYVVVSIVNDDRADAVRPFDDALIKWLVDR